MQTYNENKVLTIEDLEAVETVYHWPTTDSFETLVERKPTYWYFFTRFFDANNEYHVVYHKDRTLLEVIGDHKTELYVIQDATPIRRFVSESEAELMDMLREKRNR